MKPTEPDARIDAALRSSLDPDPATTERLVRRALAAGDARPAPRPAWRLVTAGTAAAVVATLLFVFLPTRQTSPPNPTPPQPAAPLTATSALVISNRGGAVTVTTRAGSKMIFLPTATPTGDAS